MRAPARYLAQVVDATLDGSSDADGVLEFSLEPEAVALLRDIRWNGKDIKRARPGRQRRAISISSASRWTAPRST